MHEHPQFEYYNYRKINFNDAKDFQLIREFWSAESGKGKANGMKVASAMWHKWDLCEISNASATKQNKQNLDMNKLTPIFTLF